MPQAATSAGRSIERSDTNLVPAPQTSSRIQQWFTSILEEIASVRNLGVKSHCATDLARKAMRHHKAAALGNNHAVQSQARMLGNDSSSRRHSQR
jgi:hypothetical protein